MAALLMAAWLGLSHSDGAAGPPLQGTLAAPISSGKLLLRLPDGTERAFAVDARTECLVGTHGDIAVDPSQLQQGAEIVVTAANGRAVRLLAVYRWFEYPGQWLDEGIADFSAWSKAAWGQDSIFSMQSLVKALLAVVAVSLICGIVSSLVVSNRMAFFSDALAHCAFAGFAIGLILYLFGIFYSLDSVLGVMILFGAGVGLAIAYVKEQTTLANDTVIGVFFAGSMGLGAVLLGVLSQIGSRQNPENFLFGDPFSVSGQQLVYLLLVLIGTLAFLFWRYNGMALASFNPSLARSRQIRVRLGNYSFIVLLALVVNICLNVAGALLINALLILPAAAAGNLARNLRAFFWLTAGFSLAFGLGGFFVSVWWQPEVGGRPIHLGCGGAIVLVGVALFFASILLGRWTRGARTAPRTAH